MNHNSTLLLFALIFLPVISHAMLSRTLPSLAAVTRTLTTHTHIYSKKELAILKIHEDRASAYIQHIKQSHEWSILLLKSPSTDCNQLATGQYLASFLNDRIDHAERLLHHQGSRDSTAHLRYLSDFEQRVLDSRHIDAYIEEDGVLWNSIPGVPEDDVLWHAVRWYPHHVEHCVTACIRAQLGCKSIECNKLEEKLGVIKVYHEDFEQKYGITLTNVSPGEQNVWLTKLLQLYQEKKDEEIADPHLQDIDLALYRLKLISSHNLAQYARELLRLAFNDSSKS